MNADLSTSECLLNIHISEFMYIRCKSGRRRIAYLEPVITRISRITI